MQTKNTTTRYQVQIGHPVNRTNSLHDLMSNNSLAAAPAQFVTTITQAAREWAEECFNTHQP